MKKEPITLEMFKIYEKGQATSSERIEKKQDEIASEQKDIREALVKLTEILAETQVMGAIFHNHIRESDKNFNDLFKTMRSREGYFRFAGYLKVAGTLILAGGLGAYGQEYYKQNFATVKTQEEATKVKPITKDLIK